MAGVEMTFSLQARIYKMAIKADAERVYHIDEEIPAETIKELRKPPAFVRAYDEGGLAPEEFITFGVIQKTISQFFWTGWAPLEQYISPIWSPADGSDVMCMRDTEYAVLSQ